MDSLEIILVVCVGIFAGYCGGFFGIGGGTVIVPIMINFGFDIKQAIGISIMQMLFSSMLGSYINYKTGKLKFNDGIYVGIGGMVGASFSGYLTKSVPSIILKILLLIILMTSIYKFFQKNTEQNGNTPANHILFIIGFFVGILSISVGIGGGGMLTPILVGFFGVDIKKALSLGLFFVVFSSISGFISQSINGNVNYIVGLILGVGSFIGVYFGVNTSHKISKTIQKRWLLGLYITMFLLTLKEVIIKL